MAEVGWDTVAAMVYRDAAYLMVVFVLAWVFRRGWMR